ncbi:MAG: EamA family transporter [Candidatus Heimdallarchaeum endolithica]|uniref:EamA family transporter n=1 Tax=Candidatus Heimdallarchaeum endolithica TaxID=2876572 RepID=A0A9Y1BSK6_9ARCH|nr:MAG: EamA family transporter [Candidatus Heimdallarchaeum endolithica]
MINVSILAIPIALAGNASVMLGYVLQKKAIVKMDPIEKTKLKKNIRNFLTNPIWLTGLFLTLLSTVASIFAYAYGNIVLVASINGSGLMFLSIFSYFILKEKLNLKEVISFILIIIGVVLSGLFSSKTNTQSTVDEFWSLFTFRTSVLFQFSLLFVALILLIVEFSLNLNPAYSGIPNTLTAGIFMSLAVITMKGWSIYFSTPIHIDLTDYKFWLLGGLNTFLANIATILMQISYQKAKALVTVPIYHSSVLLFPTIYAALFLKEWVNISTQSKIYLSFSLSLIIFGILFLVVLKRKNEKSENE